jgi:hypothetical protein
MAGLVPLNKPPDVLNDRVEQILAGLGYREPGVDRAFGFVIPPDYPRWVEETNRRPFWWEAFRAATPPALLFWHRTSPRELVPKNLDGLVSPGDPPPIVSGMQTVILDPGGRLVELQVVPPQHDAPGDRSVAPNWKALFDAAGQDFAAFAPVTPEWNPRLR